jgi:hypothetical protein
MAADATGDMACFSVCESVVFLDHFKEMNDPRQSRKVPYPLDELLLCLAAMISRAKTVFRDDECCMRKQNAPVNFATIKPNATNLLRKAPGKGSTSMKSHKAAWDDDFRASVFSSAHAASFPSPDSPGSNQAVMNKMS